MAESTEIRSRTLALSLMIIGFQKQCTCGRLWLWRHRHKKIRIGRHDFGSFEAKRI